jgi:hypothetical protein
VRPPAPVWLTAPNGDGDGGGDDDDNADDDDDNDDDDDDNGDDDDDCKLPGYCVDCWLSRRSTPAPGPASAETAFSNNLSSDICAF